MESGHVSYLLGSEHLTIVSAEKRIMWRESWQAITADGEV
jgi:hypothetical protein